MLAQMKAGLDLRHVQMTDPPALALPQRTHQGAARAPHPDCRKYTQVATRLAHVQHAAHVLCRDRRPRGINVHVAVMTLQRPPYTVFPPPSSHTVRHCGGRSLLGEPSRHWQPRRSQPCLLARMTRVHRSRRARVSGSCTMIGGGAAGSLGIAAASVDFAVEARASSPATRGRHGAADSRPAQAQAAGAGRRPSAASRTRRVDETASASRRRA
mmetsp:Transcript_51901/g.103984  ORF Transcript_51901/g.103984 Transcript_51901/m.103984 type:complete len:213 (+) Transcript_51901:431-1069(+)